MPIVMYYQKGQTCPMILCDHCNKPIERAVDGVTVYPEYECEDGVTFQIFFAHRGECHDAMEEKLDETGYGGWQPLEYDIHFLLNNIKFTPLEIEPYSIPEG